MLSLEDFEKVEIRIGTIVDIKPNKRARIPAYKVTVDFGEKIGLKNSSAQITDLYKKEDLIGKQVIAVMNFEPIRIADVKSEVRILGVDDEKGCILLNPERPAKNGNKVF